MGRPFELLLEAVEPLVRDWTDVPEPLEARAEPIRLLLAPAAAALARRPDRDYGPEELLRAGVDLVRHLIGATPTVLVFDDLHWADAASLDLLQAVAGLVAELPFLLVALLRPDKQAASWTRSPSLLPAYLMRVTTLR